jgi:voltage-dependent calcium channel T type alpha-1G
MTKCADLPPYVDPGSGRRCNGTAYGVRGGGGGGGGGDLGTETGDKCVNWNRYYSSCRPVGNNPFQGAISFDNIGLAWVAIFQVEACLP